ncbi:glycosyltransferase [bacterium]|nr:MAG: glycosyltransferase [bacterium]
MKRLPISVCLITKNEEQYLDSCLKSVKDWVNEIIVVDTGSTDRTVEIAKENGAKVSYFEWIGDFSAARNESISKATNPWILQLDADEEIIQDTVPWFFDTYPWLDNDGFYVQLHNLRDASSDEILLTHKLIRFYRNHPEIHYKFKIHENIIISSGIIGQSDAQILHKGYAKDVNNEAKSERNLQILLNVIKENPKDPFNHYYAAQSYMSMGKSEEAYKACVKALNLGVTYPVRSHVYRIVFAHLTESQNIQGFADIEKTIPNELAFPELSYYRALMMQKIGELEAARTFYNQFVEICNNPPKGKLLGDEDFALLPNLVNAYTNLSLMDIHDGYLKRSLSNLYKAIEVSPMSSHVYSIIAKNEMMLGNKAAAVHVLKEAVKVFEKQHVKLYQKTLINKYQELIQKIEQS